MSDQEKVNGGPLDFEPHLYLVRVTPLDGGALREIALLVNRDELPFAEDAEVIVRLAAVSALEYARRELET